jgi:hypothetical protein
VIIRHDALRLHNYKTNWEKYGEEIANNINLKIILKNPEDLDSAIETLIKVMQQAALQSTPPLAPHKCMNNTPLEIKELLREKERQRALWQRTHFPAHKTRYNQLTDKLKTKLKKMREASFTDYVHNHSRHDYSICKPVKNIRKPKEFSPPIRTTSTIGPWARSNKEKSEHFPQHFANLFTPHNEERDQKIEKKNIYGSSHRFTTNFTDYHPEGNQRSDQII